MKISVLGCGYVGAVTGTCFADLGHEVTFNDIDEEKVKAINLAKPQLFEPGLDRLIEKNRNRIYATLNLSEAICNSDITFLCVGTPSNGDGSINLEYIRSASEDLGKALKKSSEFHLVVVKSTVLPGTAEDVVKPAIENESGKEAFKDFGIASNPEFLREGSAVQDFFQPDRIVVGYKDAKSKALLESLYSPLICPKVFTDLRTAEMVKYVSNAFLATKISFANEIGNFCKAQKIDAYEVFDAVGLDRRINPAFFRSGMGFGGSCFPKDVRALVAKMEDCRQNPRILRSVLEINEEQPIKMIDLLKKHLPNLRGANVGLLGLAFKPDTDDIRDSRAIVLAKTLIEEGARITAYDPAAKVNFMKLFPQIRYVDTPEEVLEKTDIVLIATDWKDFEDLNYTGKLVVDGKRIERAKRDAAVYEGVCW
jgi:UDPglucose 6-dehydrogenase